MTQSCWTCCLSLRDSAKKKRFTESCRIWEAGSRTHHRAACALHPLPLSTATSLRLRQILPHTPLLSLPQGEALESHCGNLHVSPSLLSSPGDWLPSECHQKRKKTTLNIPGALCLTKTTPESVQSILSWLYWGQNAKRNELWSLVSNQQRFTIRWSACFKTKKKKKKILKLLLWYNTKVWTDFVLVLLLCRQFLVVERTVILFSYWMKCLVWMLFIWGDILYMTYFQST